MVNGSTHRGIWSYSNTSVHLSFIKRRKFYREVKGIEHMMCCTWIHGDPQLQMLQNEFINMRGYAYIDLSNIGTYVDILHGTTPILKCVKSHLYWNVFSGKYLKMVSRELIFCQIGIYRQVLTNYKQIL